MTNFIEEGLWELWQAKWYLGQADDSVFEPNRDLLQMFINVTFDKLKYYDEKYGLPEIERDDVFYIEDIPKFYSKKLSQKKATE